MITAADKTSPCDLNYNGVAGDTTDVRIVDNHLGHCAQVDWTFADSVAGCPAGDSVVVGHPSLLRVLVSYRDASCNRKAMVPPDSIWILGTPLSGNVSVNDLSLGKVFADDSTDANGIGRISIRSLSGCGSLKLDLYVSGGFQGSKIATIRTTDPSVDANGRVTSADENSACDIDYSGAASATDQDTTAQHLDHWRRNALHGTLVRRTAYENSYWYLLGSGQVFWSPSGRFISYGGHAPGACKMFYVPSDPAEGNATVQLTFSTSPDSADYDPSWSPLNTEFTFGRKDQTIYRRGLPWHPDSTHLVTTHDDQGSAHDGDLNGAISPDGQWLAFSRRTIISRPFEIFKIPMDGDTTRLVKLTEFPIEEYGASDYYPQWSPDGQWIVFQRQFTSPNYFNIYRVRADGNDNLQAEPVFDDDTGRITNYDAVTPAYSPDSLILLIGYGPRIEGKVVTYTLDPALTIKRPIANYDDPRFSANLDAGIDFPLLSPRLSPDGTRLSLAALDVWATRRNMNLPPVIVSVGGTLVADTSATVDLIVTTGSSATYVPLVSTDPEDDLIHCQAFFLESWMDFDTTTCRLILHPSGSISGRFFVRLFVTTASGGCDAIIAVVDVNPSLSPESTVAPSASVRPEVAGPNPTVGSFSVPTPVISGATASLTIYDLSGRRVAHVRGSAGDRLEWNATNSAGERVPAGLYLYRLDVGVQHRHGKIMVVR